MATERSLDYADALDAIVKEWTVVTRSTSPATSGGTPTPQPVAAPRGNQRTDLSTLKRDSDDEQRYRRGLTAPTARATKLTVFADREREYDASDFGLGPKPGAPPISGEDADEWAGAGAPKPPVSPIPPSTPPAERVDPRSLPETQPGVLAGSLADQIGAAAPDPASTPTVRLDLEAIRHVEVGDDGAESDAGPGGFDFAGS